MQLLLSIEDYMFSCPTKELLHFDCPGCGLQRSLVALFKGDFLLSWELYPPTVFILATLAMLITHLAFSPRYGLLILKLLFIITTITISANYIYKILNHQLI